MDRLTEIANRIGTDKGTTAFCGHSYTITYNEYFAPIRSQHVKMLEIGVADPRFPGASTKMWAEYFPDLYFVGFDINKEAKKFEQGSVQIFIGDQNNPTDLEACLKTHGEDFDIIVDDGSHFSEHIITSFKHLFKALKKGGYYIIEDLHSVYSNAAYTVPQIKTEAVKQGAFSIEQKHSGKMLVIRK